MASHSDVAPYAFVEFHTVSVAEKADENGRTSCSTVSKEYKAISSAPGCRPATSAVAVSRALAIFVDMLPLASIRMATLAGLGSDHTLLSGRFWPSSYSSKSLLFRSLTRRPRASRTCAATATCSTLLLKTAIGGLLRTRCRQRAPPGTSAIEKVGA